MKTFPQEQEQMFKAIEFMVEQATGGAILDNLTRKTFRDTKSDYFNRLKKEALSREDGLVYLFKALLCWYETWKDTFNSFNDKNAKVKYTEQPVHTWLHCLLTGQQHVYHALSNKEMVLVGKSDWEELSKSTKKMLNAPKKDEVFEVEQKEKIKRLLKLYENDLDVRLKELLLEKRIAIFLNNLWSEKQIEEITQKYNLLHIRQYSAFQLTPEPGIFDYYLFLTSQASHSVKYKLEKSVPREKLFLISSSNKDMVMDEFLKQLRGRL